MSGENERLISVLLFGQQGAVKVSGQSYDEVMPSYSFLSDDELAVLIKHIRTNFGNKGEEVNAAEVAAMRTTRK